MNNKRQTAITYKHGNCGLPYLLYLFMVMCDFLSNTNDDLHCLLHYIDRCIFKRSMEITATCKYIRVGKPLNDNCEPSVPPRIGAVFGSIFKSLNTF